MRWASIIGACLVGLNWANAQTCCSGGVPLANNVGGLPISPAKTWQLSVVGDFNTLKTLKSGSETLNDDSRERKTTSILLKSSYSITDRLFVESLFTWVRQDRVIHQSTGQIDFERTRGLGDAVVLLNYSYLNTKRLNLTLGAGPKLPTGQHNLSNQNGLKLNADLQPGSGAWDGVLLHRVQGSPKQRPSMRYFANITYRFSGVNREYLGNSHYQFGNEFQILAGIAEQIVIGKALFSATLNTRYRQAGQDLFNRQIMPNTGGQWIFVMPAIGWHITQKLMFNVIGELPAYSNIKGTQLSPSYRITSGLYCIISPTKK